MENQHRKIQGYRDLTREEINLMNEIKGHGQSLSILVEKVKGCADDARWCAIGKTHLQQGLMALTRAVAKPEGF